MDYNKDEISNIKNSIGVRPMTKKNRPNQLFFEINASDTSDDADELSEFLKKSVVIEQKKF